MTPRYPVISSGKAGDVTDCHLINGVWVGLWLDILSVCMETIETVEPVPVTSHGLLSGRRLCGKNLPIIWYQMSITGSAGQPVNFVIITKLIECMFYMEMELWGETCESSNSTMLAREYTS